MWFVAGIVFIAILAILVFQLPGVQNFAARKAVAYLRDKLDTKVELESINIGFPRTVNIKGLFVADRNDDTLLYAGTVNVGINMPALLKNKLIIQYVNLKDITGKIYRNYPDTTFNYTFIVDSFTGDTSAKIDDDTTGSMIIDFHRIKLEHIRFLFNDTLSGIKTAVWVGKFETEFIDFDLSKQVFKVQDVELANSSFSLLQTTPLIKPAGTEEPGIPPDIGFENLSVRDFNFSMLNLEGGNELTALIRDFEVQAELIDIPKQKFAFNSISLEQADISFEHSKPQHFDTIVEKIVREEGIEKKIAAPDWEFRIKQLSLADNKLKYQNHDSIPKTKGIDFNNILVSALNLETKETYVTPGKITLELEHMDLKEKSGFELQQFSSAIHYDTTNITLDNLLIRTPRTTISDHLEVNFKSLAELTEKPEEVVMNVNLSNTRISVSDILYFVPELSHNPDFSISENDVFSLKGGINGTLADLSIENLMLSNQRSTRLEVTARVKNVTVPARLFAEVKAFSVSTTKSDIDNYLEEMIPQDISVPERIDVTGSFTGYLKNFDARANVNSTYGNIKASIAMDPGAGNLYTKYKADVQVEKFDLGRLLNKPDTLGPVSLEASVNGTGFNPDSLNAEVYAIVNEAFYNGYIYHNLQAEGFVVNRSFHGEVWIHDNNLDFNYTGYVNLHPDSLAMLFDFKLNGADLKALHLTTDDLKIRGAVSSDLAKRYGPNPLGKLKIYDVEVIKQGFTCPFDSLVVESFYDYDSSIINIRSEFLNASFRGDIVLQYLPGTLLSHLNKYFTFQDTSANEAATASVAGSALNPGIPPDPATRDTSLNYGTNTVPQNFRFNIMLDDPNYICENLIPGLKKYIPLTLKGTYNSEEMALKADAELPLLDYNGILIDSLSIKLESDKQELTYNLEVGEISNKSLMIQQFSLDGNISDDKIRYNISAQKADTFNVLKTGGYFSVDGPQYKLVMDEPFILNNTAWRLDPDNVITFTDNGINAQKVILTGQDQMVSIITQPGDYVPLKIAFDNFKLMNISIIIEKEQELARGNLNGHFTMLNVNGVSAFTSDLKIDSLYFMGIPVGNIALLADNSKDPTRFDVDLRLSGYGNEMAVTGNYLAHDSVGSLNLMADIPHLNMSTIEPFTFGQVSRLGGYLNGNLKIGGTTASPDPNGYFQFNEVTLNAPFANTFLRVGDNRLNISNKRININNLSLSDTLNNSAKVNGYADFSDLTRPLFDIRVVTDNFLAMNAVKRSDEMPVYGTVFLDSDIRLRGSASNPVIDMSVKLNNGTKVTYVLPEEELTLNESEGIVVFSDTLRNFEDILKNDTNEVYRSSFEGVSLDASITFEPQAMLKVLVDPAAGDSLFVNGEGTLNFSLEPGGQMNLTGNYAINSGGYNLTLNNLIKRQFSIAEGSSITWTGDIIDAMIDLNAIYRVRTSPMILVEDQMEGMEEAARNTYRNTLTFMVYLKMKGKLTKPDISFDIQQPEEEKGALNGTVNARLNELRTDETQLNKQVFALLTLNRFMGQDPFETGSAPLTVESATRASASKLLTQQFSALSEKYIKGVDLDVGVRSYEDYSSGEEQGRTQLELGLTKEFMNDRLMIQVGGNVDLEGERAKSNDVSNIAGNLNVEYKLTPQGRYRLRAFRRIEYENPIEGELTNTGVGVSYSRDFRGFKQLFRSEKKRQDRIRERQAKFRESEVVKEREAQLKDKETELNETEENTGNNKKTQ